MPRVPVHLQSRGALYMAVPHRHVTGTATLQHGFLTEEVRLESGGPGARG
jgi:hypothetical protein